MFITKSQILSLVNDRLVTCANQTLVNRAVEQDWIVFKTRYNLGYT